MIAVQLFDQDIIRMTFIIGIMTSALLYERTHLTTGSLVVPGYVAAQLLNPAALVITALNSILTYLVVARVLPRYVAIYGRALFVANILVSILLSLVFEPSLTFGFGRWNVVFDSIGYVVPALIAYDMKRQGPSKTLAAVVGASALAAMPALWIVTLFPEWIEPLLPTTAGLVAVDEVWFPIAALVSAVASTAIQANYGLRSGGFIGSMYLGLIAVQPTQLIYVAVIALATYGIVVHGLGRTMILFGRRKFAVMLVAGSLLSWFTLQILDSVAPGLLSINQLPIAALFVPALLANDMQRTSIVSVVTGGLLAGSVTLSSVVGLAALVDGTAVPPWVAPLLVVSAAVLLWPQISQLGRKVLREPPTGGGSGPPTLIRPLRRLQPLLDDANRPGRARSGLHGLHGTQGRQGRLSDDPMEPLVWKGPLIRRVNR